MKVVSGIVGDLVSAMFSYEFLDGGVSYDAIERIHQGDVDDWVSAIAQSGLLGNDVCTSIRDMWRRDPQTLFDLLLGDADEMTIRRCRTTWAALDRLAPLAPLADIG